MAVVTLFACSNVLSNRDGTKRGERVSMKFLQELRRELPFLLKCLAWAMVIAALFWVYLMWSFKAMVAWLTR